MAPKKKEAGEALQDGPAEEEVQNLPGELQTLLGFSGFCKEFRTGAAETSGWEFTKDTVIRLQNQELFNDIVERPLVVSLRDASTEALIGSAEFSLVSLLHDTLQVSVALELKLTPEYHAKWWKEDEEDAKKKDKSKEKTAEAKERTPLFDGEAPPATILTVDVRVEDFIGPSEDRDCWTILSLSTEGILGLPEALTALGTSPEDFQGHPITYSASLLGESFGEGLLTKPAEARPEEVEEEWRVEQMRYEPSIRFTPQLVRYRGKGFIEEFREMLSTTGGVYLYIKAEERPPVDPKKPNPSETAELARQASGCCWVDLRGFVPPGGKRVELDCPLEPDDKESACTSSFTRLAVQMSFDVTPAESEEMKVHPSKLLPERAIPSFTSSEPAVVMYQEVVQRSCEAILQDCHDLVSVEDVVKKMKEVGSYEEVKQSLRESMICIFRERLRKDTSAVPGKPLAGQARQDFVSSAYSYLQLTAAKVLDQKMRPDATGDLDDSLAAARREAARLLRLAEEAELVGNWTRAAQLLQNRFLIQKLKLRDDPLEWLSFAKFLARCRQRQQAAQEALQQVARLMGEGKEVSKEVRLEVELFLACLALDQGRHEEAIEVFERKHREDFANSSFRFFLGLALFLRCRWEESRAYLESAGKPREWFQGLPDEQAVVDKLKAFRRSEPLHAESFAVHLEQLLSFGLPDLIFTFTDQTDILPEEELQSEIMILLDARASALDRKYFEAMKRLEQQLQTGSACHEVWKLAGECCLQMQDYDRALKALQTAASEKLSDATLFIRLGSVLLVKKRWKQARDAFLQSIQSKATAEAWSGVAYAELRSDEVAASYEALREANLLDNERHDVWALLSLVHLRNANWDAADHACRQCLSLSPQCDDLLLEMASELEKKDRQLPLAEACCRRALDVRDSGQAHGVLADVLAHMGKAEASVLEAQVALKMLVEQPDLRKAIYTKALKLCQDLDDKPLTEAVHACQKLAEEQYAGRKTPPLGS